MPTYDYQCESCGPFELRQPMSEDALTTCPKEECGGAKVRRVIGRGLGVIFKGSGFYCTDYPKEKPKPKEDQGG